MPFLPGVCVFPFVHAGLDYKASFYDFPKAADAIIKYYEDNPTMDGINHIPLSSGKSDETSAFKAGHDHLDGGILTDFGCVNAKIVVGCLSPCTVAEVIVIGTT